MNRVALSEEILRATEELAVVGVDNPALDARILIAQALGCDRAALLAQADRILTATETDSIQSLIGRRAKREPVARILGLREFWGLPFGLNEATLEPRPDSETLIEAALELYHPPLAGGSKSPCDFGVGSIEETPSPAKTKDLPRSKSRFLLSIPSAYALRAAARPAQEPRRSLSGDGQGERYPRNLAAQAQNLRVLDLGAGTGCLLLALLHELPQATGLGVDIAPRAVEQATINAERLGLSGRATFQVGDWLDGIAGTFDLIISNPPYISAPEIPKLMSEVREYDPLAALDGGTDGLDVYRRLIPQLSRFLNPDGFVVFEVGQRQASAVSELLRAAGFTGISVRKDLGGVERCVVASFGQSI